MTTKSTTSALDPISVEGAFHGHTKTRQLVSSAGPAAIAALMQLVAWIKTYRVTSAFLDGAADGDIEKIAGWNGSPGALIAGLLDAGFLQGIQGERMLSTQTLQLIG